MSIADDLGKAFNDGFKEGKKEEKILRDLADAKIERLERELRTCRNELCLRCGEYKRRHKGACEGCRWEREVETE